MEKILTALRELGIDIYRIEQRRTRTVESFFVRRNLDLKRDTDVTVFNVTVYKAYEKDGEKLLGASDAQIHPGMEPEEIRRALEKALYAASLAGNPYYEPPKGKKEEPVPAAGGFAGRGLEDSLRQMIQALFAADCREDVFLNSAELFMKRQYTRIVNSSGVDVSYEVYDIWGEYVVQCPAPRDVETYHQFSYRTPEPEALRRDVEEALDMTKARAQATCAPETGEYALILSGRQVRTLLGFYLDRANSSMVYQRYSPFQVGAQVQGEDIQGDALSMELVARDPYSAEGIPMRDRPLLDKGVLKTLHGGARFAWYLGIEPTGSYESIRVPAGSVPAEELKKGKTLHVVCFSDFQMDELSGHFGGEIRLGFLRDGDKLIPVTGGSVNGSILEAQKHMRFSKECTAAADYEGPLAVRIEGVQVAGR